MSVSVASANVSIAVPNAPNNGWNFIWNGIQSDIIGGSNTDVYQPALSSGTTPIETLVFQFGSSASGSGDATTYTATTNDTSITLNGSGKAIQMGANGTGTLKVNFSNINNTNFILDLSNTNNLAYSFVGNIHTIGTNYNNARTFKAIFGASVKGNITLDSGGNTNAESPSLTFNNGAKLEGNLKVNFEDTGIVFNGDGGGVTGSIEKTSSGQLTINFNGNATTGKIWNFKGSSTITFNGNATVSSSDEVIYTGLFSDGNHGSSTIVFNGEENKIINTASNGNGYAIFVNGNGGSNVSNTYNKITFTKGTNTITGNIQATTNSNNNNRWAKNTIIFEEGTTKNTITGNITAENYASNELSFKGGENSITGNITSKGNENQLTFESNIKNTITGNITANVLLYTDHAAIGRNTLTFSGDGATNEISGDITAELYNGYSATNTITFSGEKSTNTIKGILNAYGGTNTITFSGITNKLEGNLSANGGTNNITFESGTKNSIVGDLTAQYNPYSSYGKNNITFNTGVSSITGNISVSNGSNTITFDSNTTTNTITGNISASGGTNTITFGANTTSGTSKTTASNTLTGNLSATGGTNTITFNGSSNTLGGAITQDTKEGETTATPTTYTILANGGTNNITANGITLQNISSITAGSNGNQAINRFNISGDITFKDNSNLVITAFNKDNTNTDKHNIFKFGGDVINRDNAKSNTITIAELTAASTSGDYSKTKNILSFDGLTQDTNLTITSFNNVTSNTNSNINNKNTGYTYIGKDLTQGSGSSLALASSFNDSNWSSKDYQATNLTLNAGSIYAKYGKN
ncbi:hypothetical protein CQA57_08065, partial [Helicobacter anseris]